MVFGELFVAYAALPLLDRRNLNFVRYVRAQLAELGVSPLEGYGRRASRQAANDNGRFIKGRRDEHRALLEQLAVSGQLYERQDTATLIFTGSSFDWAIDLD